MSLLVGVPLAANPAATKSYASTSTAVRETVTIGTIVTTWTHKLGTTTLEGYTNPFTRVGGISGQGISAGEATVFADGTGPFNETATIFGTVLGRTGAYVQQNVGTTGSDGSFQGRSVIVEGIGGLAGLRGTGTFEGINTSGSYTAQVYFDPS
jgi:hypothetical protein